MKDYAVLRGAPAQSALSSARMVKNGLKKLGLPLWSHLTVTGDFNVSMILKI
jgi:hypothetical protein